MRCPTVEELPPPPPGRTGWPWTCGDSNTADRAAASADAPMRVTIVTPSYNQADYLEETIRSVLLQKHDDLEYIIIDGGSDDASVQIIGKYAPWLAWWESEKDQGQSHAINKGFARSTGRIHAYLNSDDTLEPGALRAVTEAFEQGERWVVGQVRYLAADGATWPLPAYPERSAADWFLCCPVPQPASFWDAHLHRAVGPFRQDLSYYFDYEFWMRLRFRLRVKPAVIAQTLAVYRLHEASKTVAASAGFPPEARLVRSLNLPLLSRRERRQVWIAQRRKRACAFGSRAKSLIRAGSILPAVPVFLRGLLIWPPLLFDRRITSATRRLLAGRSLLPDAEPPVVWDYYAD